MAQDFVSEIRSDFAGRGTFGVLRNFKSPKSGSEAEKPNHTKLGEWASTAICGNDITSSCLYVSALAIGQAGVMAPIVLLCVGLTLYLFRKIYGEVGSAIPLNGGTYTLLLNTSTKKVAAVAATLTLLSYIATAVISATEAIHYAKVLLPWLSPELFVPVLLGSFALLSIIGIGESAKVAIFIFALHLATMAVLIIAALAHAAFDPSVLIENARRSVSDGISLKAILFGFAVALLGISGFESSANFIEEQGEGVFPKTLRNMWIAVLILNPLIAIAGLSSLPLEAASGSSDGFLSQVGLVAIGPTFSKWIAINAFLVLSGAVLTSFVGTIGLTRRMALDRCLPDVLLITNRARGTNHWIVLSFLAICISIFWVTSGQTTKLAGVYTLSFLSVMIFFGIGNALLKVRRARLPRSERAPWRYVGAGIGIVSLGAVANILMNPEASFIFLTYFAIALVAVFSLLLRTSVLRFILQGIRVSGEILPNVKSEINNRISTWIRNIGSRRVLYFSKGDSLSSLNEAALYVIRNEQTNSLVVCQVVPNLTGRPDLKTTLEQIKVLDQIYPQLKIDFLVVESEFGPSLIEELSKQLEIPKNRMFIGSPGGTFPHRIENLGGVRLILSGETHLAWK